MTRSVKAVGDRSEVPPEILQWAQETQWEFLGCRDVGHAWPATRKSRRWGTENYQGRRVWVRTQKCQHRCGVLRVQRREFTTREPLATRYLYPVLGDGKRSPYLLPAGCPRLSSVDIFLLEQLDAFGEEDIETLKKARRDGRAA